MSASTTSPRSETQVAANRLLTPEEFFSSISITKVTKDELSTFTAEYLRTNNKVSAARSCSKSPSYYWRPTDNRNTGDLDRQIAYLVEKYPGRTVIKDIGSGINFNRPGLRSLVVKCIKGLVEEVVIAHRDRLVRFGFELLELVFETCRARLVVDDQGGDGDIDNKGVRDGPQQLAEDLMAIVHVFSCREYGKRNHGGKRKRGQGTDVLQESEGNRNLVPQPRKRGRREKVGFGPDAGGSLGGEGD